MRRVYSSLKSFSDIKAAPFKPRVMTILAGFFRAARSERGKKYVVFFSLVTERSLEYISNSGSAFKLLRYDSEIAIFFFETSHMERVHLSPVQTESQGRIPQNLKEFVVESPRKTVSEARSAWQEMSPALEKKNVKNKEIIKGRTRKREGFDFLFIAGYQNML